jgi:hypothetical protein
MYVKRPALPLPEPVNRVGLPTLGDSAMQVRREANPLRLQKGAEPWCLSADGPWRFS